MKLRSTSFTVGFAFDEVRALVRVRKALDAGSDAEVLRALLRAAHAELCPEGEIDAALDVVHAERVERTSRKPRTPRAKRPAEVRQCAWRRCRQDFVVPVDNKAQKYCSRDCSHLGKSRLGREYTAQVSTRKRTQ